MQWLCKLLHHKWTYYQLPGLSNGRFYLSNVRLCKRCGKFEHVPDMFAARIEDI